jgi:thiol-disulfide isomerase/thioredoxin
MPPKHRASRLRRSFALLASACALTASASACRVGPEAAVAGTPPPVLAVATPAPASAPAPVAPRPPTPPASAPKPAGAKVELPANVDWQTWDAGIARARAENKPALLLVWAHWCPRCRELAPVFGQPEIAALAKRVVMIQQNADENPAWLSERFDSQFGGYVPRVFLLRPDGTVRTDITSGNPQYPYFYVPRDSAALVKSLEAALKG